MKITRTWFKKEVEITPKEIQELLDTTVYINGNNEPDIYLHDELAKFIKSFN